MKLFDIRFLPGANEDLKSIHLWLLSASGSQTAADSFLGRIVDRCEQLREFPEIGVLRNDLGPGFRMLTFEKTASIFYRLKGETVEIINVFYRGRDYDENSFTLQ